LPSAVTFAHAYRRATPPTGLNPSESNLWFSKLCKCMANICPLQSLLPTLTVVQPHHLVSIRPKVTSGSRNCANVWQIFALCGHFRPRLPSCNPTIWSQSVPK